MSASCHSRDRLANRKIPGSFTLRRATRYGGLNARSDFVYAAGIDAALTEALAGEKAAWATYGLAETMRHLLDGYLLGVERVWHFAELAQEPLLCTKRGRGRLPDPRCSIGSWPASRPRPARPVAGGGRGARAPRPARATLVHAGLRLHSRDGVWPQEEPTRWLHGNFFVVRV